jgi:hypothetical protein
LQRQNLRGQAGRPVFLYVALSRAKSRLMPVLSRDN